MKAFPEDIDFVPVRRQLSTYRQMYNTISLIIYAVLLGGGAVVFNWLVDPNFWHGFAYIPVAWAVLNDVAAIIITPFQVRVHGWSEQPDDLMIRSGAIFRTYEAVPYGRLQFVNVKQGPLQRAFDIADVTVTSAGATATIAGLPTKEATRLRDDLTQRGYARLAGL